MSQITQTFNTIGVITGRDLIGDALLKLPFARALRHAYPKAEISWITSQGPTAFGGVLRPTTKQLIDKIYEQPTWLETSVNPATTADAPHFDLLIDTRNRWREAVPARKIPHKLFIAMAARYLLSEKRPSFFRARPRHLCDRLLQMVELAAGYQPPSTGSLPVSEELMEKARRLLPEGSVYIGLAPGCGSAIRMWPRWKFEKVGQTQAEKGRVPVFILGPQELGMRDIIRVSVPSAKFPLQDYAVWGTDAMNIDHTLAVGKRLNLAIGNDSGAGHILAAVDCPILSLFGPTTPLKAAPRTSHGRSICAQEFGSNRMKAITWEAVNAAVDEMLSHS